MIKRLPPAAVICMRSALMTLRLASQIPAHFNFDGWAHKADMLHRPQLMSLLNWLLIIIGSATWATGIPSARPKAGKPN